jgi:hypothetical protein
MVSFYCRVSDKELFTAETVNNCLSGPSATIACMAKFKPVRTKKKNAPAPQGALPCVILVILAIAAVMLMLVFVMKSFSSN